MVSHRLEEATTMTTVLASASMHHDTTRCQTLCRSGYLTTFCCCCFLSSLFDGTETPLLKTLSSPVYTAGTMTPVLQTRRSGYSKTRGKDHQSNLHQPTSKVLLTIFLIFCIVAVLFKLLMLFFSRSSWYATIETTLAMFVHHYTKFQWRKTTPGQQATILQSFMENNRPWVDDTKFYGQ